ncbi:MAG: ATP-binding protein, partial [Bacteroidota bacterium]
LDFAKIDAGMLLFERVPFDLRRLLENLADTFRFKADEQRLRLNLDLGTRVPAVVSGDPVRLRQVLGNLLSNAVKFTEAGYVTLRARCVAEDEAGTRVRIEVEDTGIGIPADQLGAVFESFTQARSDTTRKYGGTGLGLAIVRALVEGQGGTLGVQSTEGEGSTFAVELTFGRSEGEVPARIEADETDIAGVRVLLVEDNRVNQLVATEMLRGWGAQVEVAHDGREGVEHALAGTYDLVLMDVQMPEMDGYEATRRIRAAGRTELPIIALTASALVEQRRQAEAAGMDDFVMKPFDPADLRRRIAFYAGRTDQRPDAAPPATPAFDLDVLRRHVGGDESFLEKMLVVYRQEWPPLADELLAAGEAADWPRVVFAAHKAKANAALLGAADLAEQLRQIESAAEAGPVDVAAVRDAVDEMRAVVDALHA